MRMMSFALTTAQFLAGTKTVTRRLGWADLEPGQVVCGVQKCMGLKPGEKVNRLRLIVIVSNRPEGLSEIDQDDVIREGFPDMTPEEFVTMFARNVPGARRDMITNRIEYRFIPGGRF